MAGLEEIVDVPLSAVEVVRKDFESEGARVSIIQQADGKYTVSARFIIGQAIKENRTSRWLLWLLYAFAVIFVLTGITTLVVGIVSGQAIVSVAGAVTSCLFWPAIRVAVRIRRENLAPRISGF